MILEEGLPDGAAAASIFAGEDPNPFRRYRRLLASYHLARHAGLADADWISLVDSLDREVARIDGHGFRVTPLLPARGLARTLGVGGDKLLVKDETGNVSGSHKGRHLFGVMLWLEARRQTGAASAAEAGPLAIASCGNAALAAAVVAAAAGRPLVVFVPPAADRSVVDRLRELGAEIRVCPRQTEEAGDPCLHRFRAAVGGGALPFTCQGSENGLVIDGGQTLVWEVISQLRSSGRELDRLFIQVGGGALASACIEGLAMVQRLGLIDRLPRLHTVQSQGCSPLRRAWERFAARLAERHLPPSGAAFAGRERELAARLASDVAEDVIDAELHWAAAHRARFMWPWESEPKSVAGGILDDETYDWLTVVGGLVKSGGWPLVVDERTLREAERLGVEGTGIPVDATGAAGLAGLLELRRSGGLEPEETMAVLFTGRRR